MTDQTPSGDHAVFIFLEGVALAFSFATVESLLAGKPWSVSAGCTVSAVVFFLAGVKWPRIRASLGDHVVQVIEWLAQRGWLIFAAAGVYVAITRPQYRSIGIGFAAGCLVAGSIMYVRALRRDLDRYVMPRRVTRRQARRLRDHLKQREQQHSIIISSVSNDTEAHWYADQIFGAFRDGGWSTEFLGVPPSEALGDGVRMLATGNSAQEDPNLNCQQAIQRALSAAHIRLDGTAGFPGSGQYRVHLVIGRRPLVIFPWQPTLLTRFGQWVARIGRRR